MRGSTHGHERGSSAVELVLLAPLLMLVVFVIVQTALYMHARHVVLAAAQQGARIARSASTNDAATVDAARAGTYSYLRQLGGQLISDSQVNVTRGATQVTVRVSAHAVSILPGFSLHVVETSTGPVETFRSP